MNPILLAPTTLPETPPLEYIEIAARAGYDGIGLRLYPSPGMTFFPIVGDRDLMRRVKEAIAAADIEVYDIFTCYLEPDMDLDAMRRAHEFGAEMGAKVALVIGDDPEWDRMVDHFGRLCDNAASLGLVCALESPVNTRRLNRLELGLRLIEEAGRDNVAISFDPAQFYRAGHTVADLEGVDRRLLRYTQINDTDSATPRDPLCMPGEGKVPLRELLDALPQGLPLSLEYRHQDPRYTAAQWAQHALDGTRRFLDGYYATKG